MNAAVRTVYNAASKGRPLTCAGRVLSFTPPAWARTETAEQECRRIASMRVCGGRFGRVHMGNGYGPGGEWYETGDGEEKLKSAENSGTDSSGPAVEWKAGRPDVATAEATLTETGSQTETAHVS